MLLPQALLGIQPAADTAGVMVEDVFSTSLHTGNGAARTIATGVDLTGTGTDPLMQGGLVWLKARSVAQNAVMLDTVRGVSSFLVPSSTTAATATTSLGFTATGYTLDAASSNNTSGGTFATWTFRRAKKFFDIVTWTGNGAANRQIPHNLGGTVGMVITKATSTTGNWNAYHRSATGDLALNSTATQTASRAIVTAASDTTFTVSVVANTNGVQYVAYLFAHDDTADGLIQCGSFTTDASGNASVNLGWEPGWMLFKSSSAANRWFLADEARGWTTDGDWKSLNAQVTDAEAASVGLKKSATGFSTIGTITTPSTTYVYMAIRRGPMRVPTTGTSVFQVATGTGTTTAVTPADMHLARFQRTTTANTWVADRLRGYGATGSPLLKTNLFDNEATPTTAPRVYRTETDTTGPKVNLNLSTVSATYVHYAFNRAPGFFDTVAYTGNGVNGRTVEHNLQQAPTMMWVKNRTTSATGNWIVYHNSLGATSRLFLSATSSAGADITAWNNTAPSSTVFTVGTWADVNENGVKYVAYLFGDVPGVSKCGSYTGSASDVTVDCGFSPRFVLIKRTDQSFSWLVFDSARGIVAGADPWIALNTTGAEATTADIIDPVTGGFSLVGGTAASNAAGGTFCYYAIA